MATIEARITKVEHDTGTGWFSILTDHDSVKKLTTKIAAKADEANQLRNSGEVALIEYSPKDRYDESTGRTYHNAYYERAKTAVTNGNQSAEIEQVQQPQQTQRMKSPEESWKIALSVGAKLAVQSLPHLEDPSVASQRQLALNWAVFLENTPRPAQPATFTQTTTATTSETTYDQPPPPGDDDIPF